MNVGCCLSRECVWVPSAPTGNNLLAPTAAFGYNISKTPTTFVNFIFGRYSRGLCNTTRKSGEFVKKKRK